MDEYFDIPIWVPVLAPLAVVASVIGLIGLLLQARHTTRHQQREAHRDRMVEAADSFIEAASAYLAAASDAVRTSDSNQGANQVELRVTARRAGNVARTRVSRVQLLFGLESPVAQSARALTRTFKRLQAILEGTADGDANAVLEEAGEGIDAFVSAAHTAVTAREPDSA